MFLYCGLDKIDGKFTVSCVLVTLIYIVFSIFLKFSTLEKMLECVKSMTILKMDVPTWVCTPLCVC